MRACGMLLPVSSLPSPYGIGAFSESAYRFVDTLKEAGQKYWQILPLGPTSYGDSPYQSSSTFAGNPYFIDLDQLIKEGLLLQEECDACDFGSDPRYIDYGKLYGSRFTLLKKAYTRSLEKPEEAFETFKKENSGWVGEYALYMAVKNHFNSVSWNQWDEDIRNREEKAMEHYRELCREEIDFYTWLQYEFYTQWGALKDYANQNGIQIIGDIPIYVAFDSADTWAAPEMFQFDEKNEPKAVAGCPPDGFSATGQLWGNPLYDWEYHKKTCYQWWIRRIEYCFKLYDIVRIDHFRGFDEYYSIPYGDETAEFGHWEKGPGIDLFNALKEALGEVPVIAEDLGFLTPTVLQLVKDTGYPGMKVLEFAFDSREESDYLPHTYPRNCVVYTGTHDNETVSGWYKELNDQDRKFADDYLNLYGRKEEEIPMEFVRAALSSVADTAIIPVQDYLGLGKEARINTPSTLGNNWKWRMLEGEITPELTARIRRMTKLYGRLA